MIKLRRTACILLEFVSHNRLVLNLVRGYKFKANFADRKSGKTYKETSINAWDFWSQENRVEGGHAAPLQVLLCNSNCATHSILLMWVYQLVCLVMRVLVLGAYLTSFWTQNIIAQHNSLPNPLLTTLELNSDTTASKPTQSCFSHSPSNLQPVRLSSFLPELKRKRKEKLILLTVTPSTNTSSLRSKASPISV